MEEEKKPGASAGFIGCSIKEKRGQPKCLQHFHYHGATVAVCLQFQWQVCERSRLEVQKKQAKGNKALAITVGFLGVRDEAMHPSQPVAIRAGIKGTHAALGH